MATEIEPDLKLEIAHVLTIDLVAYSILLIQEQSRIMAELNKIVRDTARFRAGAADGKLTRLPTGDGMALVFFGDPEAPIECAMQISMELKNHPEIRLRMGIHSGPINQILDVNDRSNLAGAGIDMAQRVMDCGDAGHILVSKHVADDLVPYSRWNQHLHDLGECEVKHGRRLSVFNFYTDALGNPAVPEKLRRRKRWKQALHFGVKPVDDPRWPKSLLIGTVLLSALALVISFSILFRRPVTPPPNPPTLVPEKSIAVLPFENRSEEKANEYFTDGLQDEILTRLAAVADLKVISRTSTQHYKSTPENVPVIARQLGVSYVVEGSVQRIGDDVHINVQVIKAATDSHVWAATFDRKLTDIFSVQSDLARAVANHLQAHLTAEEEQRIAFKSTNNPEAYDAYLRGLACTLKAATTPGNTIAAQKYLRQAVKLDPKFALSWALLAYVDALSYLSLDVQATDASREEARVAAETALKLQPNLGEALHAMGFYHYACLKNYDTAVSYFEQARRLLPNSSRVPVALAYVARRQGYWDRCEAYFNEAERLDPRNAKLLTQRALSYVLLREFPKALQKLEQVLEIAPDDVDTIALKAAIAQAEGNLGQAAALLEPLRPTAENFLALEQQVYQGILERKPAAMILRLQEILAESDPPLGYAKAELRFWLGWAQEVAGDHAGAGQSSRQARDELESFAKEQPQNNVVLGDLALVNIGLGDEKAALALVDGLAAVVSQQKDAVAGNFPVEILVRVAARMGDADRAVSALERLLTTPYDSGFASGVPLTPALLRFDPTFDKLRADPRFQKLAAVEAAAATDHR